MKIGLSLGSGGARGYAHIGVLQALEEAGIEVDLINGSSIGAIVGGAWALYQDVARLIKITERLVREADVDYFNIFRYPSESRPFLHSWLINALCDLSALRGAILSHKNNVKALEIIFGEHGFHDTQIPFSSVACDLLAGETVVIEEGGLIEGVLPSIAIPGIFPPVERDGQLLVDGGILADVPVRELRGEGAEFIIAVELGEEIEREYHNGFGLLTYIDALKAQRLRQWELVEADFQIEVGLPNFDSMRFDNYEIAIAQGYKAARRALPELLRRLDESRI